MIMRLSSFLILAAPVAISATASTRGNSNANNKKSKLQQEWKENYQRRATKAVDALEKMLNGQERRNHRFLQDPLTTTEAITEDAELEVNCDYEAVNDWVTEHVEGGNCQDFNTVVGGVELCRQFEQYHDPAQCLSLDQNPTFDLEAGGLGPSMAEQCMFFVNHLLPHPYFLDLDSILPVFGSGFDYPLNHECETSEVHECDVEVIFEDVVPPELMTALEIEANQTGGTTAPTPAPYTETVPCTRCDFFYASDEVCFDADCEFFDCQDEIAAEGTEEVILPESNLRNQAALGENRSIEVCFSNKRSDIFSFTEHRIGDYYGCSVGTEEKVWTTEFHKGVSNIQQIQFKLGEHQADENAVGLDYCELLVDQVPCQSCVFCGTNDTNPHIAIDCTNVMGEDAITSCDSEQDFLYGISAKLMSLQEGYTRAPTAAPTAEATPMPTAVPKKTMAPTESQIMAEDEEAVATTAASDSTTTTATNVAEGEEGEFESGSEFEGGIEAGQLEGAAESGAIGNRRIVATMMMMVLALFC